MRQIDLEEAIAAHPMTLRAFATKNGVPQWRLRDAIKKGALVADDSKRPMQTVEGEMALTVQEWQRAIEPAANKIKASVNYNYWLKSLDTASFNQPIKI